MIVPTVIVQTPVCDRLGLGNEVVGKGRVCSHLRLQSVEPADALAHDPPRIQLWSRIDLSRAAGRALHAVAD